MLGDRIYLYGLGRDYRPQRSFVEAGLAATVPPRQPLEASQ
jgi:hypothetical protein